MPMLPSILALMLAAAAPATASPAPSAPAPAPVTPSSGRGSELGYLTAGELTVRCNDNAPASVSYCFAYVAAVHDTMKAYEIWLNQKEFCPPVSLTQSELRRTFMNYLLAYPDNRTGQASSVIVVALKDSYPCLSDAAPSAVPPPKPKK